ncbi:MAG: transposase [Chitinophagales bacterium]|jgi:putative transposase|nr:transposase [Sphingobacteriales bacterium]
MDKFNNQYRISSARLAGYDYGQNGAYFITICTKNRIHYFGEIVDRKMILNEIGNLAHEYWQEIPNHFSYIELANFVVMPNHIHGILIIYKNTDNGYDRTLQVDIPSVETLQGFSVETLQCNVSTDTVKNQKMAEISPKSGTISSIIRSYKSIVTKHARYIKPEFEWQSRFHDHIIRNEPSFNNIQNYIENNPANWKQDNFF